MCHGKGSCQRFNSNGSKYKVQIKGSKEHNNGVHSKDSIIKSSKSKWFIYQGSNDKGSIAMA